MTRRLVKHRHKLKHMLNARVMTEEPSHEVVVGTLHNHGRTIKQLLVPGAVVLVIVVAILVGSGVFWGSSTDPREAQKAEKALQAQVVAALEPTSRYDFKQSKLLLDQIAKDNKAAKGSVFYNLNLFLVCESLDDKACMLSSARQLHELSPDSSKYTKDLIPETKAKLVEYSK